MTKKYDLVIVGAGVTGSALLYLCSKYTDIKSIAVIEKYSAPAQVNTRPCQNSQTLHCGDIETNYTLEKAHVVRRATDMLRNYATSQPDADKIIFKYPKMVLGVGKEECELLRKRFEEFSPYYPNLQLMDANHIDMVEPNVTYRRKEEIVALGSTIDYTAVDFNALSHSFIERAQETDTEIDLFFDSEINSIDQIVHEFHLFDKQMNYVKARSVAICAGSHSLKIAHDMSRGEKYSLLPVAGSYYFTPELLKGKVYTVQNDALPFAAVHGDPDVSVPDVTRFGPTAVVLPFLERYNWKTVPEFFEVFGFDWRVAKTLWNTFRNKEIRNYMIRNMFLGLPLIGRMMFLKDVRKIVPSARLRDLTFANKFGGIRPQLIDKEQCKLLMGEAKIDEGNGIIFNMTPSPGGTSCIENAERDMISIVKHLDATFDEEAFNRDLLENNDSH